MMDMKGVLLQWFIISFDKKHLVEQSKIRLCPIKNQYKSPANQLLEKPRKEHSSFIDNIWGAEFADMHLISKFNKRFRFLSCFIDIFSKHTWVIPLKDKKGIKITDTFQKILNDSNFKPNKIWVDKGSKFYN